MRCRKDARIRIGKLCERMFCVAIENDRNPVAILQRYANVVPLPETRVHLKRMNDDEKTEYINANFVKVCACVAMILGILVTNYRSRCTCSLVCVGSQRFCQLLHCLSSPDGEHDQRLLAHGVGAKLESDHHGDGSERKRCGEVCRVFTTIGCTGQQPYVWRFPGEVALHIPKAYAIFHIT